MDRAKQHVALEICTPLLESIKNKADKSLHRKPPSKPTIFRVPPTVRCGNLTAYEPKLVSIGPYHRGKSQDLKAMEELKWRLLHHYLFKVPDGSKNEVLRKMKDLEKQARDCYSEVIDLDSDQFVEMLLLDGCFLVQIFILLDEDPQEVELDDYMVEELRSLLWDNHWFRSLIHRDLLLLENQIPYFVIENLLDTLRLPRWDISRLQNVAIRWFSNLLPPCSNDDEEIRRDEGFEDVDHLLHLFHKWILCVRNSDEADDTGCCNNPDEVQKAVPSVTELKEAGVTMIKEEKPKSFLAISFCEKKGVLKIPAINVDDHTNFLFANLIALEQSCSKHGMDITHYTMFLDEIINTPGDVELLHQEGIIHRDLGCNEDVASLFNKLGNGCIYDPPNSYLRDVQRGLNAYCQSSWPRWRARAMREYFSNPWAAISLAAAVLLLGLTILQSVYTVLDYY